MTKMARQVLARMGQTVYYLFVLLRLYEKFLLISSNVPELYMQAACDTTSTILER